MRGFWFMVEAALAGVILVSFVAFLATSSLSAEQLDLTETAYLTLEGLNKQGLLKQDAHTNNVTAISNRIQIAGFNHSVQICTPQECVGPEPTGRNIWAASYMIAGVGVFNPKEVRLFISQV